jgi:hypothetical protein
MPLGFPALTRFFQSLHEYFGKVPAGYSLEATCEEKKSIRAARGILVSLLGN